MSWQDVEARKLFNNVFEALNLLLVFNVYLRIAEIFYLTMASGSLPEHRVLARVLPWLAIGDFNHIM